MTHDMYLMVRLSGLRDGRLVKHVPGCLRGFLCGHGCCVQRTLPTSTLECEWFLLQFTLLLSFSKAVLTHSYPWQSPSSQISHNGVVKQETETSEAMK